MNSVQPDLHKYFNIAKKKKRIKNFALDSCQDSSESILEIKEGCSLNPSKYSEGTITSVECKNKSVFKKEVSSCLVPEVNSLSSFLSSQAESSSEIKNVPFITPKSKQDNEVVHRKRKRSQLEANESLFLHSPPSSLAEMTKSGSIGESESKKSKEENVFSVRKKLIMGDRCNSEKNPSLKPSEIREKLGKCGRLDELRERLIKLNKCEEKIGEFRKQAWKRSDIELPQSPKKVFSHTKEKKHLHTGNVKHQTQKNEKIKLKDFTSFGFEVPVSPYKSPGKASTPTKAPHQAGSNSPDIITDELYLPYRYNLLKEIFRACDTVVSLLHNRQEVITFSKLKPAIQEMVKKTFSLDHLGQIKTTFPLAYFFNQEKIKGRREAYELSLKPNFNYRKSEKVVRNLNFDESLSASLSQYRKLDSVVLVERKQIFHRALLEILKEHHTKFLQTLEPPITLNGPLRRWHPDFPIEDVPSPEPSPLPQPPTSETPIKASEMLENVRDIYTVNNRMKEAIHEVTLKEDRNVVDKTSKKSDDVKTDDVALALRGVSLSLLEKIRAREAAKAAREMTRSVESTNELIKLSRLPELARILRNTFVAEKRNALPFDSVAMKVVASHSNSFSLGEAEEHIKLLMTLIPNWCTSHKVRSGLYLKINKDFQLQEVIDKLNSIIKDKS